jgi:ATP-dependent DNA helicase RecQ
MSDPGSTGPKADCHRVLREVFGYADFRGEQAAIIDHVAAGGDAVVVMPTGGGKSLCYQIPALLRPGVGIVVSPLIALMHDQVQALRQLGVRAAFVNSTLSPDVAGRIERAMVNGEADLIYVAPERLLQDRMLELLDRSSLALFAIDEAHCVSQWGHDFRPEYTRLAVLGDRFAGVPRMALTATADGPTRRDIVEHLQLGAARRFIAGFDRPNIRYRVTGKDNPRRQLLGFIENEHAGDSGIVYCLSRRKSEQVAAWLNERGHPAVPYHAGLDKAVRNRHQERFLREERLIVVATIAFGMGIDKPDVRFVAHLDLPKSVEAYYQETGRAGRDGEPADAWMTYGLGDAVMLRRFIDGSEAPDEQKRIEHAKLNALLGYCETARCRRQVLLAYFGDAHDGSCGNCDTCLDPVDTWDGTVAARKALSNVYRTGQSFGAAHLIDVLLGGDTEKIRRFGHDQVSTYGIGAELSNRQWQSVYRQLVAAGLLRVDPEVGSLGLTDKAGPVLRDEQAITFRKDPVRARTRTRAAAGKATPAHEPLQTDAQRQAFEALRRWRAELARDQGVPPYVIFHDRTLVDMVLRAPASLPVLGRVDGVGKTKLAQYGQAVLDVLAGHDLEVAIDEA